MKTRNGFVSNSSSSSFLIDITQFPSVLDIGEYMLKKVIEQIKDNMEDGKMDDWWSSWFNLQKLCLRNIQELKSCGVDKNRPIAFRSTNFDTFIAKIKLKEDRAYYYVTTCNNVIWDLPGVHRDDPEFEGMTHADVYEGSLDERFIRSEKFVDLATLKHITFDKDTYGMPKLSEEFTKRISKSVFRSELEALINSQSLENVSDTPDFILAEYLEDCLDAFDRATVAREAWYSRPERFEK